MKGPSAGVWSTGFSDGKVLRFLTALRCVRNDRGWRVRIHACNSADGTISNENVCGAEAGDQKGCPYVRLAEAMFGTIRRVLQQMTA